MKKFIAFIFAALFAARNEERLVAMRSRFTMLIFVLAGVLAITECLAGVREDIEAWKTSMVSELQNTIAGYECLEMPDIEDNIDMRLVSQKVYGRTFDGTLDGLMNVLVDSTKAKLASWEWCDEQSIQHEFSVWKTAKTEQPLHFAAIGLEGRDRSAAEFVVDELGLSEREYILKGFADERRVNTFTVKGMFSSETYNSPFADGWFYFVDDHPYANWSHPCRYVFVSGDMSAYVIVYSNEPALVLADGEKLELDRIGSNVRKSITGSSLNRARMAVNAMNVNSIRYDGDTSHSYAVLISGGADPSQNYSRYWGDIAMIYSTLRLKYAIPKNHIKVCMSDGTSSGLDMYDTGSDTYKDSPKDLDGDGIADIGYDARKDTIKNVLQNLSNDLKADDQLFVFITDHGSEDKYGRAYVVPWIDGTLSSEKFISTTELSTWLAAFRCPVAVAMECCFSGPFIDPIVKTANRAVSTACGDEVSSGFYFSNPKYQIGIPFESAYDYCNPFAWAFNSAIRGADATFQCPWRDGYTGLVENADIDEDNRVSFYEAAKCAEKFVLNTVATYDGIELTFDDTPQYGESVPGFGASFFMAKDYGLKPKIPAAPTVSISGTTLSWSAVEGAKYYKVYRSTNPYAEPVAVSGWLTNRSYTVTKPTSEGTCYFYFVKAASQQDDATAGPFNEVRVVTKDDFNYSTSRNYVAYNDDTEFHLYGSEAFSNTPYNNSLGVFSAESPLMFIKSSGSDITVKVNSKNIEDGVTIKSTNSAKVAFEYFTMSVSATANASTAPRSYAFYSDAKDISDLIKSSTPYAQIYSFWFARPHYIYQSGVDSFSIGTTYQNVEKKGGTYSVAVSATPTTTFWKASTSADWITLYRTSSTGSGVLGYIVSENTTGRQRTGTITLTGAGATKTLTVTQFGTETKVSLSSISISGNSSVTSGGNTTYACSATMTDGSIKTVTPTWSISVGSSYASINSSGKLTANSVTSTQSVTVKASYTEGGVTKITTKSVTILVPIPPAPTGVSATDGTYSDKVLVSWTGSSGASYYNLYRSTTTTRPSAPMKTGVTSSSYSDTTAMPGIKYYYWVSAVNSSGSSCSSYNTGYRAVSISLSSTTASFAAEGGAKTVTVTANTSWCATTDERWITLNPSSGSGNGSIEYTIAANSLTTSRYGTITITAGEGTSYSDKKTISVSQSAAKGEDEEANLPNLAFAEFLDWNHHFSIFTIERYGGYTSAPLRLFDKGEGFSLVYGYGNFGDGVAAGTIINRYEIFDRYNNSVYEYDDEETIELGRNKGRRHELTSDLWKNFEPGAYVAKIYLDARDEMIEVDEGDNVGAYWFAVRDPVSLNEALDNTSLTFVTDAANGWFGTKGLGADGVDAVQSTHLGHSSTNSMTTTVNGSGIISFKWKVSSEKKYDELRFLVDEEVKIAISGTGGDWEECCFALPTGKHKLTWDYCKDEIVSSGVDCGWVDQVVWVPELSLSSISITGPDFLFAGSNGDFEAMSIKSDGSEWIINPTWSIDSGTGYASISPQGVLTAKTVSSRQTVKVKASYTEDGVTKTATKNVMIYPTFALSSAFDNSTLEFKTGGAADWFGQNKTTHDGSVAARSGIIAENQNSWMETTVTGPGTISFMWYASSEVGAVGWCDYLSFSIDGVVTNRIGGTSCSWTRCSYTLGSGSHVLRWNYLKDGSADRGEDAGFVGHVVWMPSQPSTSELADLLNNYGPFVPGKEIEPIDFSFAAGWKISGLPAGLKYNAKTGYITGKPTKSGIFRVTLTRTSDKTIANTSFEVMSQAEDKAAIEIRIGGNMEPKAEVDEFAAVTLPAGVKVYWPIEATALSTTTVKAAKLPAGLKLVQDKLTKAYSIQGVPTKAAYMTAAITVTTAGKNSRVFMMPIRVAAMPDRVVGTFNGGLVDKTGDEIGLVTLTTTAAGKISGKILKDGLTWTVSAASFDAYDEEGYHATLTAKSGKLPPETYEIVINEDGVSGSNAAKEKIEAYWNFWKTAEGKQVGKALAAQYKATGLPTAGVELPSGMTSLSLKLAASGAVTATGMFDYGYKATCSTVLIPTNNGFLVYLYFAPNVKKNFGGEAFVLRFD